jgi:hypothetical protein
MMRAYRIPLVGACLLGLALIALPASAGEVTRGTSPYGGSFKTTKWRAGKTDFVHTTYYTSQGNRNYSQRWTRKAGAGEGATIRYRVQAPVTTKGTIWTANGTVIDHRKLTDENGKAMTPERWVYGKKTVRGKGEFIAGGQMMEIKMWKAGRGQGNVLGIERTTVDGKTTVRRFGQTSLPRPQLPSFLGD